MKDTAVRFNKKRYWSSRVSLPDVKRYWLRARDLRGALEEACEVLGLGTGDGGFRDVWLNEKDGIVWVCVRPGGGWDPPF